MIKPEPDFYLDIFKWELKLVANEQYLKNKLEKYPNIIRNIK